MSSLAYVLGGGAVYAALKLQGIAKTDRNKSANVKEVDENSLDDVGAQVTVVPYTDTTGNELEIYVRLWAIPKDPLMMTGAALALALGPEATGKRGAKKSGEQKTITRKDSMDSSTKARNMGTRGRRGTDAASSTAGSATASDRAFKNNMRMSLSGKPRDGPTLKDGKAKALILVVHGYETHSRYYVQFAKFLTNEGYAVAGMDLPGHGRSGSISGIRGYVPDFKDYEEALASVVTLLLESGGAMLDKGNKEMSADSTGKLSVARTNGGTDKAATTKKGTTAAPADAEPKAAAGQLDRPLFLLGDVMGGTVVLRFLTAYPELASKIAGAILVAPLVQARGRAPFPLGPVQRMVSVVGGKLPAFAASQRGLAGKTCGDKATKSTLKSDTLISSLPPRRRVVSCIAEAAGDMRKKCESVTTPLLVLHGTQDSWLPMSSSNDLVQRAGSKDKELQEIEDGKTYLLLDTTAVRKATYGMIDDWLHLRT